MTAVPTCLPFGFWFLVFAFCLLVFVFWFSVYGYGVGGAFRSFAVLQKKRQSAMIVRFNKKNESPSRWPWGKRGAFVFLAHWAFEDYSLITDKLSLITDHWLLITDYWSLITDHWCLITDHWSLITDWGLEGNVVTTLRLRSGHALVVIYSA